VSSGDGKRIVFVRDNYFKLDDYFGKETPDPSTLNVFDETHDEPVLHVRYLAPKAILVIGLFTENGLTVKVADAEITTTEPHANHIRGGCGIPLVGGFDFN
jgi:hypothetical protein